MQEDTKIHEIHQLIQEDIKKEEEKEQTREKGKV